MPNNIERIKQVSLMLIQGHTMLAQLYELVEKELEDGEDKNAIHAAAVKHRMMVMECHNITVPDNFVLPEEAKDDGKKAAV